jgi:manganese/zinc/iron transport system permease protein
VLGRTLPEARSLSVVLFGALVTGLLSAGLILATTAVSRLKEDAALGVFLASFFGLGVVLRSYLQANPTTFGNRAGLEAFLYGSIATLTPNDVALMALPTAAALAIVAALWKELKLVSFDPDYLSTLGFPTRALDAMVTVLIVVAVVVGLQMVGVVLMSAMLIAPAVAARQWTDRLGPMVTLACLFAMASGLIGIVASSLRAGLSTGPVIAVYATGVALASLVVAPERGLAWRAIRQRQVRRRFAVDTLLLHIAQHVAAQPDAAAVLSEATLAQQLQWTAPQVRRTVARGVDARDLLRAQSGVVLTASGRARVEAVLDELGDAQTASGGGR